MHVYRHAATWFAALFLALAGCAAHKVQATRPAVAATHPSDLVRAQYTKSIHRIPMRDGVKLFTLVYTPRNTSHPWPILMTRTPYEAGSADDKYPKALGPSQLATDEGYIFVYQDVRGLNKSEGKFVHVRPHLDHKSKPTDIDESTDAYDTIAYLLKNVPNHNGRVGMWGISYPGFYCSTGMVDAHAALKAVSPQAPIGDWFFDDVRRLGTSVLPSCFGFLPGFLPPHPTSATHSATRTTRVAPGIADGYQAFLDLGSLKNVDPRHFHSQVEFWTQMTQHPNYDAFWEARNILPRLKHVAPAVLVVGGWLDTEDLYGTLTTYQAIEKQNPGIVNTLVMGPWKHTGWATTDGERLGNITFGGKTAEFYREKIELPFFNHYLKDKPDPKLPEAYVFETGRNRWRTFDRWPPADVHEKAIYVHADGKLSWETSSSTTSPAAQPDDASYDAFVSDPAKPVPFTETISRKIPAEYMTDDQRFAARRPDVLVYQTEPLTNSVTLAGPILADLWVSTSAGDADWVVKVIDVYPPMMKDDREASRPMGGYQMLVRGEVIRGRFRESYATPKPFKPNEPTQVRLPLQDVMHTFKSGHRIMVQIQSTWFPMIDRNPQKYVDNIFQADDTDFIKATHHVHHDAQHPTRLHVGVLE